MSTVPMVKLGTEPSADIVEIVERVRNQCQLPGLAVGVVNADGLAYFLGVGWSD